MHDTNVSFVVVEVEAIEELLRSPVSFKFKLSNIGGEDYFGVSLRSVGTNYNEPLLVNIGTLTSKEQVEGTFTMFPSFYQDIRDLPKERVFEVLTDGGQIIGRTTVPTRIGLIAKQSLTVYKPQLLTSKYNVLLFGISGGGKTTFLENMKKMLSTESAMGQDGLNATVSFTRNEFQEQFFNVWDMWGTDFFSEKDIEHLKRIYAGELPNNYKQSISYEKLLQSELYQKIMHTTDERKIHSTIFFVPVSCTMDTDLLNTVHQYFKLVRDMSSTPIIVLTMCDTICDMDQLYINGIESVEAKQAKELLSNLFEVHIDRIYFGINNESDTFGTFKNVLCILSHSLHCAQAFTKVHQRKQSSDRYDERLAL